MIWMVLSTCGHAAAQAGGAPREGDAGRATPPVTFIETWPAAGAPAPLPTSPVPVAQDAAKALPRGSSPTATPAVRNKPSQREMARLELELAALRLDYASVSRGGPITMIVLGGLTFLLGSLAGVAALDCDFDCEEPRAVGLLMFVGGGAVAGGGIALLIERVEERRAIQERIAEHEERLEGASRSRAASVRVSGVNLTFHF
jgi:hypothetical protein